MLTRRMVVHTGLAFAALACSTELGAGVLAARGRSNPSIDALLVDETIALPGAVAAIIADRSHALPIVGVRLDAASHGGLMRVLDRSQSIVGISSGATLFCLERIAWDHGFRLTRRRQHLAGNPVDDACCRDVAALLTGAHARATTASAGVRTYRPSRSDGALHTWVMQKPASPPLSQSRREV
jgi:hypothetical protein